MARITPSLENGKTAWVTSLPKGETAHGSTEFIVLSGKAGITHPLFVYYLARSPEFRTYAINQMTGSSGRQRVPTEAVKAYQFFMPSLSEQRHIARILGILDDKIELNRRMSETLEEMAMALFTSWFVDFDPVRAKGEGRWRTGESLHGLPAEMYELTPDNLQDSELGPIPHGWAVTTFDKAVRHLNIKDDPSKAPDQLFYHYSLPAYDKGKHPIIEYGDSIKSAKNIMKANMILLSRLNPDIERVWLVDVGAERAVASTEFMVLEPLHPFGRSYIYCLARSRRFRSQFESLVTGTSKSHQRVPPKSALALATLCPPSRVVSLFEEQISTCLEEVLAYRRQNLALIAMREALLPKLMSGSLQLGVYDER